MLNVSFIYDLRAYVYSYFYNVNKDFIKRLIKVIQMIIITHKYEKISVFTDISNDECFMFHQFEGLLQVIFKHTTVSSSKIGLRNK